MAPRTSFASAGFYAEPLQTIHSPFGLGDGFISTSSFVLVAGSNAARRVLTVGTIGLTAVIAHQIQADSRN